MEAAWQEKGRLTRDAPSCEGTDLPTHYPLAGSFPDPSCPPCSELHSVVAVCVEDMAALCPPCPGQSGGQRPEPSSQPTYDQRRTSNKQLEVSF